MEKKVKYQSKLITVASGTTAGSVAEDTIELDNGYQKCTGIAVHEVTNGSITNGYYTIGVRDQNKVYHDRTHIDNWDGGTGVAPNDKFKKIDFPVTQSMLVSILTGIPATLAADLKYEIVFRLEKEQAQIA